MKKQSTGRRSTLRKLYDHKAAALDATPIACLGVRQSEHRCLRACLRDQKIRSSSQKSPRKKIEVARITNGGNTELTIRKALPPLRSGSWPAGRAEMKEHKTTQQSQNRKRRSARKQHTTQQCHCGAYPKEDEQIDSQSSTQTKLPLRYAPEQHRINNQQ